MWQLETFLRFLEPVKAEHITDVGLSLQPEKDVESKEEKAANLDDVAGNAIVLSSNPGVADDRQLSAAKRLLAFGVELLGLLS